MAGRGRLKTLAISLAGGALIVALLYAVENLDLTGRQPIELDLAALSRADARKPLLARFPEHDFACEADASGLAKTLCWTEIDSFNGLDARYLAFFFGAEGELAAFKLAAYAREHGRIQERFSADFGAPRDGGQFHAWPTGGGVLTLAKAEPEGQEATVLWVSDPEVVREFGAERQP